MKKFEQYKSFLTNFLLAFVIFTIGFALGKNHNRSPDVFPGVKSAVKDSTPANANRKLGLKVYYMHATFRCVTCNQIEKMTQSIMNREFAPEISSGRILWEEVNFQENETLAKKFDVVASCVVVAVLNGDQIVSYERLDQVWTLLEKPKEFDSYISTAIHNGLKKLVGE